MKDFREVAFVQGRVGRAGWGQRGYIPWAKVRRWESRVLLREHHI